MLESTPYHGKSHVRGVYSLLAVLAAEAAQALQDVGPLQLAPGGRQLVQGVLQVALARPGPRHAMAHGHR